MDTATGPGGIRKIEKLGFPWKTPDPFLFCVYHQDAYPKGNIAFGPAASLEGRSLGNDFALHNAWRMYHGKEIPGFPVHPHRGFETVTVVRKGIVDHSDSLGGAGRYGHGDVQWMTAGKGIQHAEMFPLLNREGPNPLELFQIWLNLPGTSKFAEPHYVMLWKEQIPLVSIMDASGKETRVEIVAGSLQGTSAPDPAPDSWAASPENEGAIWYIQMEPGASWNIEPASNGVKRTLYFFAGEQIMISDISITSGNAIDLDANQKIMIKNDNKDSRFLLLQGLPIRETVINHGPFVMNSEEEIRQTIHDYQETRFGGWPWSRPDPVHPREKGRFARYPNGREQYPPT